MDHRSLTGFLSGLIILFGCFGSSLRMRVWSCFGLVLILFRDADIILKLRFHTITLRTPDHP